MTKAAINAVRSKKTETCETYLLLICKLVTNNVNVYRAYYQFSH